MTEIRPIKKTADRVWPKRGEIYLAALGAAVGPKAKKTGPVLVIQNDTGRRSSAATMVAPIASAAGPPLSPLHVPLPADSSTGLTVSSVAVFDQIYALESRRLIRKLGSVDAGVLAQADAAIQAAFDLIPASRLAPPGGESPSTLTEAISTSTADFKTGRYQR